MILNFDEFQEKSASIDFNALGRINESHRYSDSICSVMDKLAVYVKRENAIENSRLTESLKKSYRKEIYFDNEEKIAASCIFNEMLERYSESIKSEIELCESIIKRGYLLEEGVEYSLDEITGIFSINEGVGDWIHKKIKNVKDASKEILSSAKNLKDNGIDVIKAKKDDLVNWAKEAERDFEERYENLKKIVKNIVKKGIDKVSDFINNILEVFTSIGDNLVDSVEKLGGLKMCKGETPAKLEGIENADGIYRNAKTEEEKSFINNIINRANAIISKDKDNASKLMNEGEVNESIVDNKFIAWLAGYKQNGEKISWWKCILIGLCASVIVWMLPKVLVISGVGEALALFVGALVGLTWNGIGMLKLIYRRNKQRKPGEKFFDRKTGIFFALSLIASVLSVATFINTIGPLMREICNSMGWNGGDDMSKFGEFIYNITRKISPKNAFEEGGINEWTEEMQNYGGDVRGADIGVSNSEAIKLMDNMPGASDAQVAEFKNFLDAASNAKGTKGVYDAVDSFRNSSDLPLTAIIDTSKFGGSGPITKAIETLQDSGKISDSTILGTLGSKATWAASGHKYGIATYITGASKEEMELIYKTAAEIAGKDASTINMNLYGTGAIQTIVVKHVTYIDGGFKQILNGVPFLPMVMPFFDKKKWGEYNIRFASATRGSAAYTVDRVEMMDSKKMESEISGDIKAVGTLKKLHSDAWEEYKKLNPESVNEGLFKKNDEKDEKTKVEEPQYIVFYVRDDESTGRESDNVDKKKKETTETVSPGIVIDTLTMMVADAADFNASVKKRRRPQPYFMKGLLSRISFRPNKDNDNETKDYIRTTLGQTMSTLIMQNVMYGSGKKYIDSKVDGKEAEFTLRETVLGDDSKKVDGNKAMFELGNFSPNEMLQCLKDESKTNKISYDFLDGKYASKVSIREDADGNIKSTSVSKDNNSIENIKYYVVSKDTYTEQMDDYNKRLEKWKKTNEGKRPSKPSYIKVDGKYFKRASKKMMSDPKNKRKKLYDFVDIRIIPLISKKSSELYKKLVDDEKIKKILYTDVEKDEKTEIVLNKKVVEILKPFLYRPEKTFAKDDEHKLTDLLKEQGIEGEKLGWFKNLFKDAEQIHETFKKMVEIIWDFLSENRREMFKRKDFTSDERFPYGKGKKKNEGFETLYDELIEEFYNEEYDEETEYDYDVMIMNETKNVLSFSEYLIQLR